MIARSDPLPPPGTAEPPGRIPRAIALREALLPFLAVRLLFALITLLTPPIFAGLRLPWAAPTLHDGGPGDLWYRWDAVWYMRVATDGYRLAAYAHQHVNLAFFPLYPLLLHLWLAVWPWSRAIAAMLIGNLCAAAASYYLYRLIQLDHGRAMARRAAWLLAVFPTSLFLFAGYSEGLFLLCLVLCFYQLRLQRWWLAGICGGLAAATRSLGVILIVPYLACWYQGHGGSAIAEAMLRRLRARLSALPVAPAHRRRLRILSEAGAAPAGAPGQEARGARPAAGAGLRRRRSLWTLLPLLAIPAGLLAYMSYLWVRLGNPLAFSSSQRSWHRAWDWPWHALYLALIRPLAALSDPSPDAVHGLFDAIWALAFLGLTLVAVRGLPRSQALFLWAFWIMILSTPALLDGNLDLLDSTPRFLLTAFPLLIYLAATPRRALAAGAIFAPLLILYTAIFVSGGWVA